MLGRHARGARSGNERQRGTGARLAMLVVALVLALSGCGLDDPMTKSRTDSMRGASWLGADADQAADGSVAVLHTRTPSPDPTASPSSFFGAFETPPDDAGGLDGGPAAPRPDRILWPFAPSSDEPTFEEHDHSSEPDNEPDPCDAVGLVPDECDPEPTPTPCDDSAENCEPGDCEETDADGCPPPDCDPDGEPTGEPSESPDPTPTQSPGPSQSPESTSSPESTTSPSSTEPPDDGEPGC